MARGTALLALLALGAGAKHILGFAAHKRTRREQREAVQTWEGEGGAVPVGRSQTTASQLPPADIRPGPASAQDGRSDPLRTWTPFDQDAETYKSLGLKAVLPPPEEKKHVKTAIGAEQASAKSR